MRRRDRDRDVMVLGDAVAHGILLWATCRACNHRAAMNPAEIAQRCGYDVPVSEVKHRLRCSRCGSRDVELAATHEPSDEPSDADPSAAPTN